MENCDTYEHGEHGPSPNLLNLPCEIITMILRHMNFATIDKTRMMCRYMNNAASGLLDSEFARLRCFIQERPLAIKARMPRRQSAHVPHSPALMRARNYPERAILDEVHRILRYVAVTPKMRLAYKNNGCSLLVEYLCVKTQMATVIQPTLPTVYSADYYLNYASQLHCLKNEMPLTGAPPSTSTSTQGLLASAPQFSQPPQKNEMSLTGAPQSTSTQGLLASAPQFSQPPQSFLNSPVDAIVNKQLQILNARTKQINEVMRRGHKLVLRCVANQQRKMAEIKARQDDYELMVQAMLRKCDAVLKGLESRRSKSSAVPAYTCIKTTPPGRGTSQDASIDFQKAASSSFGVQAFQHAALLFFFRNKPVTGLVIPDIFHWPSIATLKLFQCLNRGRRRSPTLSRRNSHTSFC
ncbi:hypothetical protein HPB51_001849 [Rhipicephalus microplus]|uniref:F-box domain-containing protein n=1 Tax=Rhipicephalus microplus TaxID=6941 RepID=A0A9J6D7S8_RHIMP|nr:hypothetical protein HPB51_001849 [Rhipicephalus microplus]